MSSVLQDLRYGARSFLRQPGFTVTAILALALGIGANTAVFSVVHAVLLQPLPYPNPDALVLVHDTYPAVPSASVSLAKFEALRARTASLDALGAMAPAGLTFTGGGEPERVPGTRVSADFMRALAVEPLYGRWFTPDEDRPGGAAAIILSHQLWQRRFGGDPTVVGSVVQVSGVSRTIVGVLPDGRGYPATSQAWVPLALPPDAGGGNFLRLVGRMRDGANVEQVQSDLSAISAEFNAQNGLQRDVRVWPLHEAQVRNNRRTLLILQGTVAFVLLVACANVANLLLARSVSRRRELAIRSAIGANRGRIFRQVLTESLLLSMAGAVAGVLLAGWLMRLFLSLAPSLPRLDTVGIDLRILLFTLAVSTITGVLFGLAPARLGFKADPNESLRDTGTRSATGGAKGASRALVAAEVALALVLVIGAGLMVKSLLRMQAESSGYRTEDVFTFDLGLPAAKYESDATREFYRRLIEDLASVPGVAGAAAINFVPTINWGFNGPFSITGRPPFEPGSAPVTEYRVVTPGYFSTMGIPVLRGQEFDAAHDASGRPVVIVNETMARQHFGDLDPLGATMQLGMDPQSIVREVVGVVGDVRDVSLSARPVPEVFVPHAQRPSNSMGVVVRLAGSMAAGSVIPSIRARVVAADADLPLIRPQMLRTAVEATTGNTRMVSLLTSTFALVAALLASVGIYSLIAYSVAQRHREIGIRVALGANRTAVVRMILVEGLALTAAGVAAGLVGALFLTQTLQTLLYEVEPMDPVVIGLTCVAVFVIALVASIVPALRALRVDPMVALRAE